MSQNEMGMGLTLEETEVFCEELYNLAKGNSRTKSPIEIQFTGDNNAKAIGARVSYVQRSEAGSHRLAMKITIEPGTSAEGAAKISLQTQEGQTVFFCSATLTSKEALILAYMLRCAYHEAFQQREFIMTPRKSSRSSLQNVGEKPEPGADSPTVLEEATRYTDRVLELTRMHYDPSTCNDVSQLKTKITSLMIEIIEGPGAFCVKAKSAADQVTHE